MKIEPKGYRYEKGGKVSLTVKPSAHYRKEGWIETVLYPGPTVEAIGNELLHRRGKEVELATLIGHLSIALHAREAG
jgi:hypothetical protein